MQCHYEPATARGRRAYDGPQKSIVTLRKETIYKRATWQVKLEKFHKVNKTQ